MLKWHAKRGKPLHESIRDRDDGRGVHQGRRRQVGSAGTEVQWQPWNEMDMATVGEMALHTEAPPGKEMVGGAEAEVAIRGADNDTPWPPSRHVSVTIVGK